LRFVKRDIRDPENRNDQTRNSSNVLAIGQEDISLVKWKKHFRKSVAEKANIDNVNFLSTNNQVTIDSNKVKRNNRRAIMHQISADKEKEAIVKQTAIDEKALLEKTKKKYIEKN